MNLLKVAGGLSLVVFVWVIWPITQVIEVFIYFILPLAILFVAMGLISDGTYHSLKNLPATLEDIRNRYGQYMEMKKSPQPKPIST